MNGKVFQPKPNKTFIPDETLLMWVPPVPRPDSGFWKWNEESESWQETPQNTL
jgi:hypothetical protein